MSRTLAALLACAFALAACAAVASALPRDARLSTAGLGPIEIGMTERQVEQAGAIAITPDGPEGSDCATAKLAGDVYGMFTGPRLVRIYVRGRAFATRKGIRVGDTQRKVLATYGRNVKRSPHKYIVGGFYLKLTIGSRRLVFETDGRRVIEMSGGRKPEIDYVEGCA